MARTPSPRLPLFSIRLSVSTKSRWQDAAKKENRTLAGYIKHAVERYTEEILDADGDSAPPILPWHRWYAQAREKAREHGLRRIPVDRYREHWNMGASVEHAVQQIRLQFDPLIYQGGARGDHR